MKALVFTTQAAKSAAIATRLFWDSNPTSPVRMAAEPLKSGQVLYHIVQSPPITDEDAVVAYGRLLGVAFCALTGRETDGKAARRFRTIDNADAYLAEVKRRSNEFGGLK